MDKITRRQVLIGGAMAGAAGFFRADAAFAKAAQPKTKVNFTMPAGACDTRRVA